jgi:hypothetical protein
MPIIINGTTGISGVDGSSSAPAVKGSDSDTGLVFSAGQVTATLNGTTGNVALVSETAKTATGTAVDFTGIPSWVKRVTVMLAEVSLSGTSNILVQLGTSGGVESTGYTSASTGAAATVGSVSSTAGFIISSGAAAAIQSGHLLVTNVSSNIWVQSHVTGRSDAAATRFGGGNKTLSGTLDRIRITTVNGTDTFDAGTINIMYE